jgi:hypothetical protein
MNGSSVSAKMNSVTVNSSGVFVAVGYNNSNYPKIATSANGTVWSTPTAINNTTNTDILTSVIANSAGKFVAVGYDYNSDYPVFSTGTTSGNITNYGGMTWIKARSSAQNNLLFDTVQGAGIYTASNATSAAVTNNLELSSFNNNGFSLITTPVGNSSAVNYASWSFRKQAKFFDIVQYTGTGSAHAISHSLGSVPGCIMIKETSATNNWAVYHKGLNGGTTPEQYYLVLNTLAAQTSSSAWWNNTAPTSTQFTVGTNATVNASGQTYIAYIFADQAGGFGTTGTDNVISCGSFSVSSGVTNVNLGFEPQYVMIKATNFSDDWYVADVMRGWSQTQFNTLNPDNSTVEQSYSPGITPNATGFSSTTGGGALTNGGTYIYIAIRRPMKPPTTGTSVFSPVVQTPSGATTVTTGFVDDLLIGTENSQSAGASTPIVFDRLRGDTTSNYSFLRTSTTNAEITSTGGGIGFDNNTQIVDNWFNTIAGISDNVTYWNFRRASTFFDEVCYTGNGTAGTTINHNLTIAPQLLIIKNRVATTRWPTYNATLGNANYINLNNSSGSQADGGAYWNGTSPTSTQFTVGSNSYVNGSGANYVAYLFATCAGVSKVGTYTGNATGQSIACGFGSGGARFILIKRTDSTGNWYCFDSANGLTSSSSPYLTWNTGDAQTTGNNGVYASSGGFTLTSSASATVNINGGSYIFLAIA